MKKPSKELISKILNVITAPFSHYIALMVTIVVLIIVPQMTLWPFVGHPNPGLMIPYKFAQAILISWVLLLPLSYMPRRFKQLYIGFAMGVFLVFTATDIFFLMKFHDEFNMLFIGMILGSNPNEIVEFASGIIRPEIWLGIAAVVAAIIGLYFLLHRVMRRVRVRRWVSLMLLVASLLTVVTVVLVAPGEYNRYSLLPVKMVVNRQHIQLSSKIPRHTVDVIPRDSVAAADKPNIVIIVGESLNRDHCSLYGYKLDTNPRLSTLVADSLLYVYDKVDAAELHTINCFKRFMSTFDKPDNDDKSWNQEPTIIDVARGDGYFTAWASNQSKRGIFDNVISEFAYTTDYPRWTNEELMESFTKCYFDETVVPLVDSVMMARAAADKPLLCFVHLMGNHASFSHRYPQYANHFMEGEYEEYPESQRKIRAAYDNATRYNDRVVYDIMRRFDGTPTLVFYFSDHGLDLYHTSPDHYDHAKPGNEESERYAAEIPFMIYTTPEYKATHPAMIEKFKSDMHKPFNTTNLIYLISDILDIDFMKVDDSGKGK